VSGVDPDAVIERVVDVPALKLALRGWVVIVGLTTTTGAETTAFEEVTEPAELEITTE
jgi:hypothetical protein